MEGDQNLPISFIFFHGAVPVAQAMDIQRGATLFGRACIGCHDAGGNIIQPVSLIELMKYQYNNLLSNL